MQDKNTAKSFYHIFEALPVDVQEGFIKELFNNKKDTIDDFAFALACQNTINEENASKDELFDVLKE